MDADTLSSLGLEDLDERMLGRQQATSAVTAYQPRVFTQHEQAMAERGMRSSGVAHLTTTLEASVREARLRARVAETLPKVVSAGDALVAGEITSGHAEVSGGDAQSPAVGRRRYRVTLAQWRALIVRDGDCVWLGCDRPPSRCQAYHLDEGISDDDSTDPINLTLLCFRHHHDAHEGGRSLAQDEQCTWQVKLGLPPPPRVPAA